MKDYQLPIISFHFPQIRNAHDLFLGRLLHLNFLNYLPCIFDRSDVKNEEY